MTVAAIIVAAGESSRLGQPKQLVMFEGEPLLQRAVRSAQESGVAHVFVVLGAHHQEIQAAVQLGHTSVILNNEWHEGLASSVRAGVNAVESKIETTGVLLMTCDQPHVSTSHLKKMLAEFDAHGGVGLIASTYSGIRGTPAIFPRSLFSGLLALRGDRGARSLLVNTPLPVTEIELDGGEIDIDRPEDLAQLT